MRSKIFIWLKRQNKAYRLLIASLLLSGATGSLHLGAQELGSNYPLLPIASYALGGDDPPGGPSLSMEIAAHAGPDKGYPAVVIVHGGEFRSGSAGDGNVASLEREFFRAEFSVFSVWYRPQLSVEQMAYDVQRSVRFIRFSAATLNIDPNRIYLVGDEAGGDLAAIASLKPAPDVAHSPYPWDTVSANVQGVVLLSNVGNFGFGTRMFWRDEAQNADCRFQVPQSCNQNAVPPSVLDSLPALVHGGEPPFLFIFGTNGPDRYVGQTVKLMETMRSSNRPVVSISAKAGATASGVPVWEEDVMKWLRAFAYPIPAS